LKKTVFSEGAQTSLPQALPSEQQLRGLVKDRKEDRKMRDWTGQLVTNDEIGETRFKIVQECGNGTPQVPPLSTMTDFPRNP
jgi:hypothetical protein